MTTHQLIKPVTAFQSILFDSAHAIVQETSEAPEFFVDLNLDQIVDRITLGKQEYNLKPFFYTPLSSIDAIAYRHEILRDLENSDLLETSKAFAQRMREMREHLT
jgi:hypothetical protein